MRSRRRLEAIHSELRELRRELARATQGGEGAGRELTKTQARYEAELEDLADQLDAIQESESFRLGHAIVRWTRSPIRAIRDLARPGKDRRNAGSRQDREPRNVGRKAFPIPAGDRLLGPLNDGPRTTMFVVWGYRNDALDRIVGEVSRLQLMLRDFKPLFITDSDDWRAFRKRGYWFEYIPPADEWAHHAEASEWPDYAGERMDSIVATYMPDRIVVLEYGDSGRALRGGILNGVVGKRSAPVERVKLLPNRGIL